MALSRVLARPGFDSGLDMSVLGPLDLDRDDSATHHLLIQDDSMCQLEMCIILERKNHVPSCHILPIHGDIAYKF
jgi:hypothetical protein